MKYIILGLILCIIILSGCIFLPKPVFAYQDSNDIIGQASTLEEAQKVCEDFYRNLFEGVLPLPTPVALAQERESGGFECLPVVRWATEEG